MKSMQAPKTMPAANSAALATLREMTAMSGSLRHAGILCACAVLACAAAPPCFSQPMREKPDRALQERLDGVIHGFRGDVGLYVRHLGSGRSAAIRADETFPTASLIKVPILLAVFDAIGRGQLDYHASLEYDASLLYPGEDILGAFKSGARISLSKLVMLMITTSDNTASLWLQTLAGGGGAINLWLEHNGFRHTRVNSRTAGREKDYEATGWGQTTPREMAELLVMIRAGRAVNGAASEEMYRILTRIYYDGEALSQLPPWVQAASKQGAVDRSRSEVVLVNAPSGDYVFCVITKNQADESWNPDNEGFVLLRKVSALLWQHFEPGRPWSPAAGAERLKP